MFLVEGIDIEALTSLWPGSHIVNKLMENELIRTQV